MFGFLRRKLFASARRLEPRVYQLEERLEEAEYVIDCLKLEISEKQKIIDAITNPQGSSSQLPH